jgi:cation:H+ antiporter
VLADIGLLIVSLVLLTIGAEILVRGSVVLAHRLGVSSFFIGLTIVGFGTSAPELATGIAAGLNDKPDIVIGNVVGSNILNVALILGAASLIRPTPVKTHLVKAEVLVVIAISFFVWLLAFTGHQISRVEGALLVAILCVHLVRGYFVGRKEGADVDPVVETIAQTADDPTPAHPTLRQRLSKSALWNALLIVAGLAILTLSSRLLVDSASSIARTLGVSELVIALTIVAGGTSMPELATSVMAAIRKQSDIAVGNILGSNIFNLCCILGIVSFIAPPSVNEQVLWFDLPVMIALAIALLPILFTGARISRAEGAALLTVAVLYTVTLFTYAPKWFPGSALVTPEATEETPTPPPALPDQPPR